ncbi:hypothetical protein EBN03_04020 [Nocardia stercoris]|uniref:Uncharacterized protein n=2 Tax=Nocardia stercoris TaxID=2483361 RepID=A0A3M2LH02_9NOCA|nr:hypothetical protein EBN03_04020 [Nocardia stercoris]
MALAGVLVSLLAFYRRGRGGGRSVAEPVSGMLTVTGVSPRPAAQGEQYVTITGLLSGPGVEGETVYGRFAWDVNQWPSPGDRIDVVYPAGRPDRWQLSHPGSRPYLGS